MAKIGAIWLTLDGKDLLRLLRVANEKDIFYVELIRKLISDYLDKEESKKESR